MRSLCRLSFNGAQGNVIQKIFAQPLEWKIQWLFSIALFMEFVGHGSFGVITKEGWIPYFQVFGFSRDWAYTIMPLVGMIDITLGVFILLIPTRLMYLYMTFWGTITALLRPISGESWFEFFERSYNYGIPVMALMINGFPKTKQDWVTPIKVIASWSRERTKNLMNGLHLIAASMLIGHGGFGAIIGKTNLLKFYEAAGLGIFDVPLTELSMSIGYFEIFLGLAVLTLGVLGLRSPFFYAFIFLWKLSTEMLYVQARAYGAWLEVLERGACFLTPLLLIAFYRTLPQTFKFHRQTQN